MNEVRLIQKVGQVPFETLVENAARMGFALSGSPTLVANVPVQLMVKTDVEAQKPEYILVEKTGQEKLSAQVERLLDEGWFIYGSVVPGYIPMQAMVRGDIAVHKMYGVTEGSSGDSKDWQPVINSAMDKAITNANEYTDKAVGDLDSKTSEGFVLQAKKNQMVDERIKALDTQGEQTQIYIDNALQSFHESMAAEISFLKDDVKSLNKQVSNLSDALQMESEERRADIARVEQMILTIQRSLPGGVPEPVIAETRSIKPEPATEYPPIVPSGSVWK